MLLSPHIVNIPDILFDSKTQKNHNWPHKLRIGQIMFGYFQFSFSRFPFCNNFMNFNTLAFIDLFQTSSNGSRSFEKREPNL